MSKLLNFIIISFSVLLLMSCEWIQNVNNSSNNLLNINISNTDNSVAKINTNSEIPNTFYINEDISLIWNNFSIVDANNQDIGFNLKEKVLSLTRKLELYKWQDLQYYAEKSFFSIWTEVKVYNKDNILIWTIKEDILKSLFKTYTTYSLFDANNNKIWYSQKLEFLDTEFEILDNTDSIVAKIHRPTFNFFTDSWWIEIKNSNIDKNLLLFIPAFKTVADNEVK